MTNTLISPSPETPAPPFERIAQRRRRGTIFLTGFASALGILLIAAALFWNGAANVDGEALSSAAVISTAASTIAKRIPRRWPLSHRPDSPMCPT